MKRLLSGIGVLVVAGMAQAAGSPAYVAGTAPDHRREDAPVIREARPLDKKTAFHGIDEPYPASLDVFDSQGAWYTPFTRAGMTGRYDIRGYHRQ